MCIHTPPHSDLLVWGSSPLSGAAEPFPRDHSDREALRTQTSLCRATQEDQPALHFCPTTLGLSRVTLGRQFFKQNVLWSEPAKIWESFCLTFQYTEQSLVHEEGFSSTPLGITVFKKSGSKHFTLIYSFRNVCVYKQALSCVPCSTELANCTKLGEGGRPKWQTITMTTPGRRRFRNHKAPLASAPPVLLVLAFRSPWWFYPLLHLHAHTFFSGLARFRHCVPSVTMEVHLTRHRCRLSYSDCSWLVRPGLPAQPHAFRIQLLNFILNFSLEFPSISLEKSNVRS